MYVSMSYLADILHFVLIVSAGALAGGKRAFEDLNQKTRI